VSRLVLATENTAFEDRVRRAFDGALDGDLNGDLRYWRDGFLMGDPSRAVSELVGGGAEVVALGPGLPADSALELARTLDSERPEIGVVIVADPSPTLLRSALRAGARDVIAPDAPEAELRAALELALGTASHRRRMLDGRAEPVTSTTRVITVLCPKGGAGKTTVATNLAVGLAQRSPGRVVIVDLDLQFGDVASALQLAPEHTVTDAVDAAKLDATTLKVFLTPHRLGLFALCAPLSPVDADDIEAASVQSLLELLMTSFDYVVIDTASGLDETALAALEVSTDLVLLSAPDVPCVRGTRKEVDALQLIGSRSQTWHFVLNRSDARTGLSTSDIEATVGLRVDVSVPESRAVPLALNQGNAILESDPRAAPSQALLTLVDRFAPRPATGNGNGTGNGHANGNGNGGGLFRRSR
jgi:pilus assembly protein CpaE